MRLKLYELCCHGCGKVYSKEALMLNTPVMIVAPDGKEYGAHGCEDCMRTDRVKRAYDSLQEGTFEKFKEAYWNV